MNFFEPVNSPCRRHIWRRSWIKKERFHTATTLREFWDGSPFGIGKWPHMLPVVPTRVHSKTFQHLTALRLSRAFMKDTAKQEAKANQTDPPMVAKTNLVKEEEEDKHLEEDDIVWD